MASTRYPKKALHRGRRRVIHEGKYLRFVISGRWEWAERVNCTGIVIIVCLTGEKKLVLVEQHRVAVGKSVIELPAGLVNDIPGAPSETLESAAKRELWEETGYEARSMTPLTEGPVSAGMSAESITFFLAGRTRKTGRGGGDDTESIRVHEVPLKGVAEWLASMCRKGRLVDPKVYAGLYFLLRKKT